MEKVLKQPFTFLFPFAPTLDSVRILWNIQPQKDGLRSLQFFDTFCHGIRVWRKTHVRSLDEKNEYTFPT